MLFKIVSLFLIAMAALALFGRLRFPDSLRRRLGRRLDKPAVCAKCGRYIIGSGGCDCTDPPAGKG
ncbi:MAG TPA: hypothetical protein VGA75_00980 [Paracoccaceae bacterium]